MLFEEHPPAPEVRDGYMKAFLMLMVTGKNRTGAFHRAGLKKEVAKELVTLHVIDGEGKEIVANEAQKEAWRALSKAYIASCVSAGSNYGTWFGLVKRKDTSIALRMAEDFDAVMRIAPVHAGFEKESAAFREALTKAFIEEVQDGAAYLEKAAG